MFADSTLMSPDFDEQAYLRYALHASHCQAEQARLASCMQAAREEVQKILADNVEDMVQQVTAACRAQRDVAAVRQASLSLVNSAGRLRHTIQEPHRVISANITKLHNTNTALNTLRGILRFVGLTARLTSQLPHDLARASRTLREVEELLQSNNIRGVEVVDARMETVERAAVTIRTKAQEMLRRGDAQDASGVAASLQCLFTLGSLSRVLGTLMTEQKREVICSLMKELDVQAIVDEVSHGGGTNSNDIHVRTREVLFSRIKSALASVVQHTEVVISVWRVLIKRVDPLTHVPYLSAVENPTSVLGDYWHLVTEKLRERLQAIQKRPNFLFVLSADVIHYQSLLSGFLGNIHGLFEILEKLIEMDATAPLKRTREASPSRNKNITTTAGKDHIGSGGGSTTKQLTRLWLSQVTQEVDERFGAHIMDRHRERLHNVLSRLPNILPTASNRSTVNTTVDLQRPRVPPAAQILDTRGYTMLATQDVMMYRSNLHTLSIVLDCILQSLHTFMQPTMDPLQKWPLPPLPSVSGDTSATQLLHICVSNAYTILYNDITALLASLPEGELFTEDVLNERWITNRSRGGRQQQQHDGGDNDGREKENGKDILFDDQKSMVDKYHQLHGLTNTFKSVSEQVVQPFFRSILELLLDSMSLCVDGIVEQEAAGIGQLHSQMRHFMSHFYYLFEPQTPTIMEHTQRLTDRLLARLIVIVTMVYPLTHNNKQHVINCIQQITHIILSYGPVCSHGTVGRTTMSLKGQLYQLIMWYNLPEEVLEKPIEDWYSILLTLPLIVARLLLLQRVFRLSNSTAKKPHTIIGVTSAVFIETVEAIVQEQLHVNDVSSQGFSNGGTGGSQAMARMGDVLGALETCFHESVAALRDDAVRGPTVQWMEKLWMMLKD